jgi:hypothetical protein
MDTSKGGALTHSRCREWYRDPSLPLFRPVGSGCLPLSLTGVIHALQCPLHAPTLRLRPILQ